MRIFKIDKIDLLCISMLFVAIFLANIAISNIEIISPDASGYLDNVYAEKGKVKEALEAYHMAIKADAEYPTVYKNLSAFYRNELNNDELADYYMEKYRILKKRLEK